MKNPFFVLLNDLIGKRIKILFDSNSIPKGSIREVESWSADGTDGLVVVNLKGEDYCLIFCWTDDDLPFEIV